MGPLNPESNLQNSNETASSKQHPRGMRIAVWTALGLAAILALLVMAVAVLFHSQRFHEYVLSRVQKEASERLGTQVQIQSFAVSMASLSLDLYGLTIHGAEPFPDPPLLQVQHAEVGIRVVSILHQKWYLSSFRVDRPVVKIFTDANGRTNIPTLKSNGSSSGNTNLFDIGVRDAVLDKGEIYYNDRKSVLEADLHDLEFRASFDPALRKYSGRLSYSDGHLQSGSFKPIPHALDASFDATPSTFHLTQTTLSSGSSRVLLNATLNHYDDPQVQAQYDALVNASEFRGILNQPTLPAGLIHVSGQLQYHQTPGVSLINSLALVGDIDSQRLDVRTAALRTQVNKIAGDYSLAGGTFNLQSFRAGLLGGEVTAQGEMDDISGNSHSSVKAALHGLSLADLQRVLGASSMPKGVGVSGRLNAQTTAAWGKTFSDLVAHADATIDGQVAGGASGAVPVSSALHGIYTARNSQLELSRSFLKTPQTTLTMNGLVSNRSSLELHLECNDMAELETIADMFRTPTAGQPMPALGLAGTASFQGTVTGSTSAPHLTGALLASNFRVKGSAWKVLRTNVDVSPSFAAFQNGDLEPAARGRMTFSISTGLTKWSFTNTSPVQLDLQASQLDIADFAAITGSQLPVSGSLAASIRVHGSELNPIGQGNVSLTQIKVYDEPVRSAKLTFAGTGDEVHGDLAVQLPAGTLESTATVRPREKSYSAQLTSSGIRLEQLQFLKVRNIDASGIVTLSANGQGTFENPGLAMKLSIPQLNVQHQTIIGLNLQANVMNHVATANLTSEAVNTSISADARVNLTGDYLASARLDTQALPLQPLLAVYAPQAEGVTGQTEIHATLNGPLKNEKLLEAHVVIPKLQLAYGTTIQLAETSPIHVDYKDGIVSLQRSAIRGTDTNLEFQGSIPTSGNGSMSLLLLGTVDLHLAQIFDPDINTSGQLKFNINSNGPASATNIGGEIQIIEASFSSGDLPIGLQHGNGVLTLTRDRLNISKFQGTIGGGTLVAQGGIAYRPNIQFDLGVALNGARVLYPQGVREGVDAVLRLSGTTDNALVAGEVNLTDLSFTPAFDLSNFISQFSGGVAAPPTPGFGQNVQLNVAVRSSNDVSLVSRTLSIDGTANLQIRGTAAQSVILGRVNLNGGDLIMNGDRFILNGGTIEFVNPSQTEPVVNLALNTTVQQYDIYMRFNGPIDQLRTNYSSDPALPAADIINLLAFGQTTEANSANPSTPANQAAEGLVASQVSSEVTSRVSRVAGISQLSINPVLAGGTTQGPPGANITIQQRVTGHLFVTFSSNVASTQNQTISGQYQISPRVAVSATRDQNGGFAFDTLIKNGW
jgi:translocation and assembly module TamB